jgi:putative flippase GtrA
VTEPNASRVVPITATTADTSTPHPHTSLITRALVGARYVAAGFGSLVGDLAIQAALINGLGLTPTIAIPVSYELSLIAHFFLNDRWVFARGSYGPVRPRPAWQRFTTFQLSALVPQVVTIGIALFLVDGPLATQFADWWGSYVAKAVGTAAGFFWHFAVNFFVIWRPASPGAPQGMPANTR